MLPRLVTRVVRADQCSEHDAGAWAALESRAVEPNAYLSPHFVLPAVRHLTPGRVPLVFLVERQTSESAALVGVGVFEEAVGATSRFPFRQLTAYRTRHSFLTGLLLDRDCPDEALQALFDFIRATMPHIKAVELPDVWSDGLLIRAGDATPRPYAFKPRARGAITRAILVPATCPAQLLDGALKSRLRDLNRRKRRLQELGAVGWRWHRDQGIPDDAIEAFLTLEHMGWKGDGGSSLRSCAADVAFFREVVAGFASERRALFTELTLDDTPIASSCNFMSGNVGFGFKIGWDSAFRAVSPGWLNELEFMRHAAGRFGEVAYFDSGAGPTSFINSLWAGRRTLTTLCVPTRSIGAGALLVSDRLSQLKALAGHVNKFPLSVFAGRTPVRKPCGST